MPINIPSDLPAAKTLDDENIFYISLDRAIHQDIRPLKILLLNLMPKKIQTETQIARLIGNTPLQVDLTLLFLKSHKSKNTSKKHISTFYNTFDEINKEKFDGLIITGAPIEKLEYDEITYYKELKEIFEWSKKNVFSVMHICWGAQAGLNYHYGIEKKILEKKCFGVFRHTVSNKKEKLFRGFDDEFYVPHSRETDIRMNDIIENDKLDLLSYSKEAGLYIAASKNRRQFFITGHSEYDKYTLKEEYERDIDNDKSISVPKNYFINDDPNNDVIMNWKAHSNLLYVNWLNYYVYQETPYLLDEVSE